MKKNPTIYENHIFYKKSKIASIIINQLKHKSVIQDIGLKKREKGKIVYSKSQIESNTSSQGPSF